MKTNSGKMKTRDNFHRSSVYASTMLRGNKYAKSQAGILGKPANLLLPLPRTEVRKVQKTKKNERMGLFPYAHTLCGLHASLLEGEDMYTSTMKPIGFYFYRRLRSNALLLEIGEEYR